MTVNNADSISSRSSRQPFHAIFARSTEEIAIFRSPQRWKCVEMQEHTPSQYHKPDVSVHGHMRDSTAKSDELVGTAQTHLFPI